MHDRSSLPSPLDDRLREEPDDVREELGALWSHLGNATPPPTSPDTDASWARLHARIQPTSPPRTATKDRPPIARSARIARRVAFASVLLVVAAAALTFLAWNRPITVMAEHGQVRFVDLPDGSQVALNSGTTMRYRRNFQRLPFVDATRRTIWLEGEAFFNVQPQERTFTVVTHNAEVSVLGTSFNVRAHNEVFDGTTRVTVKTGLVKVSVPDGESVDLMAGQMTSVEPASTTPAPARSLDESRIATWRSGGFSVRGLALPAVLNEIERRFDVVIEWEGAAPTQEGITLYLAEASGPEDVLRDLASARGLRYRTTSQGFTIGPAE